MLTVSQEGREGRAHRATLPVIMLSLATVVSAVASLNVAIPSIARDTHATQTQLSWIIDAYALVFAALLLLGGAIGDRYGRRRALIAGLVVFGGASTAAMTVSGATPLIVMRGVLGIGAALVMPATLSTITSTFPPYQRTRAVGAWAGVAGASAILGLLTSGVLLEYWSWRSVFGLNVVLAAVAILGVTRFVPESAEPDAPRVDLIGAALTVAGLGALVYSVIEAPTQGWGSARTVAGISVGLLILVGFVRWELSRPNPLIDPRLFRHRAFTAATLSITVQFFAFFGLVFLLLQYLQLVRGNTPLVAALSLVPMALAMMPSARGIAPRLSQHIGSAKVCVLGLGLISGALVLLSRLHEDSSYWMLLTSLIPLGAGMGLAMTPATTAITDALPLAKQGVGSAMNDLARELGGALGIAVLGSLMQSTYRSNLDVTGLDAPAAERARSSLALAAQLGRSVEQQAQMAFADGMQVALLCAAIVVAATTAVVVVLLRNPATLPRSTAEARATIVPPASRSRS
jgi:EmrB/QacA subfamily drug resistance transporter